LGILNRYESIDIFDNPYIGIEIAQAITGFKNYIHKDLSLRNCTEEEVK
jgi:hypothetical protein